MRVKVRGFVCGHTCSVNTAARSPAFSSASRNRAGWRELVLPKEHGSWSLALEPLVLGLLVAPSWPGTLLALSVAAAFFARRPLKFVLLDSRAERRAAARGPLVTCMVAATAFFSGALFLGGTAWLFWLLPAAGAGVVFLGFDLRQAGREGAAEVAGAAAFALMPAAIATLAGRPAAALALALVMTGRAVPTVMLVRANLRAAKTGVRRDAPALIAAGVALAVGMWLAQEGLAPRSAAGLLALLAIRAVALLLFPRPVLRARTLGIVEAVLGAVFVFLLGAMWRG